MLVLGGPSAKVGLSAMFGVAVLLGGPSAKVGSSANFSVVVFKASILNSPGGSSGQSRFLCQFRCTGIQGIYS